MGVVFARDDPVGGHLSMVPFITAGRSQKSYRLFTVDTRSMLLLNTCLNATTTELTVLLTWPFAQH